MMTALLKQHGQGGPCTEEAEGAMTYQNSFLIADPAEAWVLETAGSMWAAEKVTSKYTQGSHGDRKTWTMEIVMEHKQLAKSHGIYYQSWDFINFAPELYQICMFFLPPLRN